METLHVIACGAIAREVLAVIKANGLSHIELSCLPAIWHNHPERIAPGLRAEIAELRAKGANRIFIGYADCGTGGDIERLCAEENVTMLSGPHCYSFFTGNDLFASLSGDDITSFYLTDFLARQFEAFVVEPLGLDRHPELKEMYFSNYRSLVYLSQEEDPALQEKAKAAADFLGLEYRYLFTGYGDLATEMVAAART